MKAAFKGTVYLVGAGPGNPDLLTLRAAHLLATADTVMHDDLVPQAILDLAGSETTVVSVGKRSGNARVTQQQIHTLMIGQARKGLSVVRLKCGDPLIFGRAGEEIEALKQAQVPFEIVPGVTAMFAAAAAAQRSLTDRRSTSKVILTTAHHAADKAGLPQSSLWRGPLPKDATLGIYMPGRDLRAVAWDMLQSGLPAELPCLLMSHVSLPQQSQRATTLGELGELEPGSAPMLLLAGWPLADQPEIAISELVHRERFESSIVIEQ